MPKKNVMSSSESFLLQAVARFDPKAANRLARHSYFAGRQNLGDGGYFFPRPILRDISLIKKQDKSEYVGITEERKGKKLFNEIRETLMNLVNEPSLDAESDKQFRLLYVNARLMANSRAYRSSIGMNITLDNISLAYQLRYEPKMTIGLAEVSGRRIDRHGKYSLHRG